MPIEPAQRLRVNLDKRDQHGRLLVKGAWINDDEEIVRLGPVEHPTLRIDGVPVCIGDTVETAAGFRGVVDEIHTCSLRFLHKNGWPVTAEPGVCRLVRFAGEEHDRDWTLECRSEHSYGVAVDYTIARDNAEPFRDGDWRHAAVPSPARAMADKLQAQIDATPRQPLWTDPGNVEWHPADHTLPDEQTFNASVRDWTERLREQVSKRPDRTALYAQLRAEIAALDLPGVDVTTDMVGAEALIEVRAHGQRAEIVARPYCNVWHAGVDRVPDWIRGIVAGWDAEAGARIRRDFR